MKYTKKINVLVVCCFIVLFSMLSFINVSASSKYVATNNGKSYTSLSKALKNAKSGDTITVTSDITTSSTIEFDKSINLTINFAGNMYKYTGSNTAFDIKKGNISIKQGKVKSKNYIFKVANKAALNIVNGSYDGYIYNKGVINVSSGRFSSKDSMQSNNDELFQNYGILTIDGGTFTGTKDNAVCNYKNLTINKGTFKCSAKYDNGYYPVVINLKKATTVINGGTFTGKGTSFSNEGTATIKSGTFKSTGMCAVYNLGKITISGGKYTYGTKKYFLIANERGNMTIQNGSFNGSVSNVDGKLKINGGTFSCSHDAAILVFRYKPKTTTTIITGGKFTTKNNNVVVNGEKCILKISGGSFTCKKYYYVLSNYGNAYLTGGNFSCKNNASSILSNSGSILKVSKSVKYTGKITYE